MVVFSLHGIRTRAEWQRSFADLANRRGIVPRLHRWNFGYFSVLRLLLPQQRAAKVDWFRETYRTETSDKDVYEALEGEYPSIIAHSFGTYILGNALLRYDYLRFDKVLLCGSILPRNFPWHELIDRGQVGAVRNEYGARDFWSRRAKWFVRGTGGSGIQGFQCVHERVLQEKFNYSHSEYFEQGHMEAKWLPFLFKHLPPLRQVQKSIEPVRENWPIGLYGLYVALTLFFLSVFWKGYVPWDAAGVTQQIKRLTSDLYPFKPDHTISHNTRSSRPNLYVLSIGIGSYPKDTGIRPRRWLGKDAWDIAALLKGQSGGFYHNVTVRVLDEEKATRDAIMEELDWLTKETTPNDVAVLFLAGHGVMDEQGEYFFLPYDAKLDRLKRTALRQADLNVALTLELKGKVLFFFDTCYSRSLLYLKEARLENGCHLDALANELAANPNGPFVFYSATGNQPSQERDEWMNGAFTKALLEGLNGQADQRSDNLIDVDELDWYLSRRVTELTNGNQTPVTAKPKGLPSIPIALVR
jgi:hypothetical protein